MRNLAIVDGWPTHATNDFRDASWTPKDAVDGHWANQL